MAPSPLLSGARTAETKSKESRKEEELGRDGNEGNCGFSTTPGCSNCEFVSRLVCVLRRYAAGPGIAENIDSFASVFEVWDKGIFTTRAGFLHSRVFLPKHEPVASRFLGNRLGLMNFVAGVPVPLLPNLVGVFGYLLFVGPELDGPFAICAPVGWVSCTCSTPRELCSVFGVGASSQETRPTVSSSYVKAIAETVPGQDL